MFQVVIKGMHRRTFLRRTAAGGIAVGSGVTVGTPTTATARQRGGARHVGTVWTRGHFEITWAYDFWRGGFRQVELTDGHSRYDYGRRGTIPWGAEEVAVVAHGWLADRDLAQLTYNTASAGLRGEEYDVPVVGFEWDADTGIFDWGPGREIARRNGYKLAAFLWDLLQSNPDVTVRLMGHSLGARIALVALQVFEEVGLADAVESVDLFGAAIDNETVTVGGEYYSAIRSVASEVDNYYSRNDGILKWAYSTARLDHAVGLNGAEGGTALEYEDHDVTDRVPGHVEYFMPDTAGKGCAPLVVEEWTS